MGVALYAETRPGCSGPHSAQPARSGSCASCRLARLAGVGAQQDLVLGRDPFPRAGRAAFAIVDVVSRRWIDTLTSIEETSTQVAVIFERALATEGLTELLTPERVERFESDPTEPILLACSDNGPQMTSKATRELFAGLAVAQRLRRPRTPTDQAWTESLFGHVKAEWPHLEQIRDPAVLDTELQRARSDYNSVRLHAGIRYVTPDDEHTGRGEAIRQARIEGPRRARQQRIDYHRRHNHNNNPHNPP